MASFLESKRLIVTFANTLEAGTAGGLVQNATLAKRYGAQVVLNMEEDDLMLSSVLVKQLPAP